METLYRASRSSFLRSKASVPFNFFSTVATHLILTAISFLLAFSQFLPLIFPRISIRPHTLHLVRSPNPYRFLIYLDQCTSPEVCWAVDSTMENGVVENGVCSSESVNGGRDLWSKGSDSSSADHLVVMVNGILGRSESFYFLFFVSFRSWNCTGLCLMVA